MNYLLIIMLNMNGNLVPFQQINFATQTLCEENLKTMDKQLKDNSVDRKYLLNCIKTR